MDCTLYSNPEYGRLQVDVLIEKLGRLRGKTFDEMNNEITLFKNNWAQEHEERHISIGNTFTHFGISIRENVQWREELIQPEQYLVCDLKLRSALELLKSRYALAIVTNNPVSIAIRTLSVLGVEDLFHGIVGLDTCGVSKPSEEMFMRAANLCGAAPESCVSVGDRYDIDIALPLELGMGGILVDGVEDVYNLPEVIV
jgi:phosphoglycolate phosphatase/putative hydrolase of the HAD superfamily